MMTISLALFVILMCIITIPIVAFYLYCNYRLMEKCGEEGWKGLIPFYNIWIYIRLSGLNWWYIFLIVGPSILLIDAGAGLTILCEIVITFVTSLLNYNLCKKINNGKNQLIVDTVLLTFLPLIYLPIIALSDSFKYDASVKTTPNSYIDEIQTSEYYKDMKNTKTTVKKEEPKKAKFCDKCGEPLSKNNKFCPNCGRKI